MTAREHAEEAARRVEDASSLFESGEDDASAAVVFAEAQAHALTALALAATDPAAGLVVYTREGR